ncbi:MAG: hypothetical protein Q7T33_08585 [Dehalococcoidia bacterium]|nr:hypothetical protein [Dehalococcoidia bacterium]
MAVLAWLLATAVLSGFLSPAGSAQAQPPPNSVTIIKDAVPNDLQDFPFLSGPVVNQCPPASFPLDDDASVSGGDNTLLDSVTFALTPGCNFFNTFQEIVPAGWALTNIVCTITPSGGAVPQTFITIGPGGGASFDPGDTQVNIDLASGEAATCTFTDERVEEPGSITICKETIPPGGTGFNFGWSSPFIGTAPFTLDDGDCFPISDLSPSLGPFTFTELQPLPAGWTLVNIVCSGGANVLIGSNSIFDPGDTGVVINLGPGENVTCTFTNARQSCITIVKDAVPNDPQDFAFTGGLGAFTLDDDGPAGSATPNSQTFCDRIGLFTVTEQVPAGWVLANISCTVVPPAGVSFGPSGGPFHPNFNQGDTTVQIEKGANGIVICTFTNRREALPPPPCTGAAGLAFLGISTGTTGIGMVDPIWTVVSAPSGAPTPDAFGILESHPIWVVAPSSTHWIDPNNTGGTTPIGSDPFDASIPYVYETSFTVPANIQTLTVTFQFAADDDVQFFLNSTLIPGTAVSNASVALSGPVTVTQTNPSVGTYTLRAEVINKPPVGPNPTGLLVKGTVRCEPVPRPAQCPGEQEGNLVVNPSFEIVTGKLGLVALGGAPHPLTSSQAPGWSAGPGISASAKTPDILTPNPADYSPTPPSPYDVNGYVPNNPMGSEPAFDGSNYAGISAGVFSGTYKSEELIGTLTAPTAAGTYIVAAWMSEGETRNNPVDMQILLQQGSNPAVPVVLAGHVAITNGWAIIGVTGAVAAGFDKVIIRGVNAHNHAGGYVYIDCVVVAPSKALIWGDVDCSETVSIGDAQKIARDLIGLPISQEPGCPQIGDLVEVDGVQLAWADVDCMNGVTIGDAQKIGRKLVELPVSQEEGCPDPGSERLVCYFESPTGIWRCFDFVNL